jgi:hypothetical protein
MSPIFPGGTAVDQDRSDPCDFALVAMLGPLGLRIFELSARPDTTGCREAGSRVWSLTSTTEGLDGPPLWRED